MKQIWFVFLLLTAASALSQCPMPTFGSTQVTNQIEDYVYDAVDEYQAQFGVPLMNRTNMYVGYHYEEPCEGGEWYEKISYDGEFFFFPAPRVHSCDVVVDLPVGCHYWFFYDGNLPFSRRAVFIQRSDFFTRAFLNAITVCKMPECQQHTFKHSKGKKLR